MLSMPKGVFPLCRQNKIPKTIHLKSEGVEIFQIHTRRILTLAWPTRACWGRHLDRGSETQSQRSRILAV